MVNHDGRYGEQELRDDCVKVWQVLAPRGFNAESITYTDLADESRVNLRRLQGKSEVLRRIHMYCNRHDIGPLCVLVVDGAYWVPRRGYRSLRRQEPDFPGDDDLICYDRERVRRTDWTQVPEPTEEEFLRE